MTRFLCLRPDLVHKALYLTEERGQTGPTLHLGGPGQPRVVYDRVQKRKNYFEIPTFLQIEREKSRAGKFKTSNKNEKKPVFFLFSFDFEFEFPTLDFPHSI